MQSALSSMEYPYWLIVVGCVLLMLGFIGLAFRQKGVEPDTEAADAVEQGPSEPETDRAQTQAAARDAKSEIAQ